MSGEDSVSEATETAAPPDANGSSQVEDGVPFAGNALGSALPGCGTAKKARFQASIHSDEDDNVVNEGLARLVLRLELELERPIWMLAQQGNEDGPFSEINYHLFKKFQAATSNIQAGQPVALLVESPGGSAHFAYRIARLFQRRASDFMVIVPQYAKSAATLIACGARTLVLAPDAELGPLDVQMLDREREDFASALDAVQSLERLNAFAMTAVDQTMGLLTARTRKRTDTILPHVLTYVTAFVRPLLEKIDTVDFTKKSRELKVAEEYAVRLMKPHYPFAVAKRIARKLVESYPTHGFVIDRHEAGTFEQVSERETFGVGLSICETKPSVSSILSDIVPYLDDFTVIGRISEVNE